MRKRDLCFDPQCLELARYFYPKASEDALNDLAQRIQDLVESEDIEAVKFIPPPDKRSDNGN